MSDGGTAIVGVFVILSIIGFLILIAWLLNPYIFMEEGDTCTVEDGDVNGIYTINDKKECVLSSCPTGWDMNDDVCTKQVNVRIITPTDPTPSPQPPPCDVPVWEKRTIGDCSSAGKIDTVWVNTTISTNRCEDPKSPVYGIFQEDCTVPSPTGLSTSPLPPTSPTGLATSLENISAAIDSGNPILGISTGPEFPSAELQPAVTGAISASDPNYFYDPPSPSPNPSPSYLLQEGNLLGIGVGTTSPPPVSSGGNFLTGP
jgi:hypothetical protein